MNQSEISQTQPATVKVKVTRVASANIPTESGNVLLCLYENSQDNKEHMALVCGDVTQRDRVLVRVHSECFTGDVLGSRRCDCGPQLEQSLAMISAAGCGMVIYLRQEGRGIGLRDKLRAYNLQDQGYDTVEANLMLGHQADEREYSLAAQIMRDWQVRSVRLLTNNLHKVEAMRELGINVVERVPLQTALTPENAKYLRTKAARMRHLFTPAFLGI